MSQQMDNGILPQYWIEDSVENYFCKYKTTSNWFYIVIIIAVVVALLSLPFIYIDISVEGTGIIRPKTERSVVTSPVSEIVEEVFVREGDHLVRGQKILCFRTTIAETKIRQQEQMMENISQQCHDLSCLTSGSPPPVFHSSLKQQEYKSFVSNKHQIETAVSQSKTEWLRHKALFDKELISEEEYDKYLYQFKDRENELESFIQNQLKTWRTDLDRLMVQEKEIVANIKSYQADKNLYTIYSPINGTIEDFNGIYGGLTLQAGTKLAVISPDDVLYMEAYIDPKDIAFIQEGMDVKIQIESFHYNEWGFVGGKVWQISSDYVINEMGRYQFKVKVLLDTNKLVLKSTGKVGEIKKGMTGLAHFIVARKSLFDILYHNMDLWINPTQNKLNHQ